jgi:pimeloyl-ACP methyl ester carboxylesterase
MSSLTRSGHCKVDDGPLGVSIYYELHGQEDAGPAEPEPERVIMIMGLAATGSAWRCQVEELTHRCTDANVSHLGSRPLVVCTFDNRGVGRSSAPSDKKRYTTKVMADDVLLLMDHLGWKAAHVVGFSMGGMIATKLAAAAPHRLLSLCTIAVTGGGWECLPRSWKAIKYTYRAMRASTPHQRAAVDLRFHFSKRSLRQHVRPLPARPPPPPPLVQHLPRAPGCAGARPAGHRPPAPAALPSRPRCWLARLTVGRPPLLLRGGGGSGSPPTRPPAAHLPQVPHYGRSREELLMEEYVETSRRNGRRPARAPACSIGLDAAARPQLLLPACPCHLLCWLHAPAPGWLAGWLRRGPGCCCRPAAQGGPVGPDQRLLDAPHQQQGRRQHQQRWVAGLARPQSRAGAAARVRAAPGCSAPRQLIWT